MLSNWFFSFYTKIGVCFLGIQITHSLLLCLSLTKTQLMGTYFVLEVTLLSLKEVRAEFVEEHFRLALSPTFLGMGSPQ